MINDMINPRRKRIWFNTKYVNNLVTRIFLMEKRNLRKADKFLFPSNDKLDTTSPMNNIEAGIEKIKYKSITPAYVKFSNLSINVPTSTATIVASRYAATNVHPRQPLNKCRSSSFHKFIV